jgi:hypothetical protein
MINTDKYEGHTEGEWDLHSMGDGWTIGQLRKIDRTLMQDAPLLLAEVKRLREENELLRKADWEYECLWTWLAENTNLLNTIEPLMEEWKKELIE